MRGSEKISSNVLGTTIQRVDALLIFVTISSSIYAIT